MYMDLLYRNPSSKEATGKMSKRAVYHLCLDKSMQLFFPDLKRTNAFFDILTALLTDKEDITFRQDIFKDFINNPELFSTLSSVFEKFKETHDSHYRSKSSAISLDL